MCIRAGDDDDHVLAVVGDEDDRHARRRIDFSDSSSTPGLAEPGERLVGVGSRADAADHADVGAEPGRGDRLVRPLSARYPLERRTAHRLTRSRQALDPCDEVEVDRPDDGELR